MERLSLLLLLRTSALVRLVRYVPVTTGILMPDFFRTYILKTSDRVKTFFPISWKFNMEVKSLNTVIIAERQQIRVRHCIATYTQILLTAFFTPLTTRKTAGKEN